MLTYFTLQELRERADQLADLVVLNQSQKKFMRAASFKKELDLLLEQHPEIRATYEAINDH